MRSGASRASVYARHYASFDSLLRGSSVAVLGRISNARRGPVHGELLSYLFLAREFIDELIALGRRDGERWLQEHTTRAVAGRAPCPVGHERRPRRCRPAKAQTPHRRRLKPPPQGDSLVHGGFARLWAIGPHADEELCRVTTSLT